MGGRGLKSVETQYKITKLKTAIKLYTNRDSAMELVRRFDEKCERNGRRSIVKDAKKYAEEMGLELSLSPGAVVTTTESNEDISSEKVGKVMQYNMNAKRMKYNQRPKVARKFNVDPVDRYRSSGLL